MEWLLTFSNLNVRFNQTKWLGLTKLRDFLLGLIKPSVFPLGLNKASDFPHGLTKPSDVPFGLTKPIDFSLGLIKPNNFPIGLKLSQTKRLFSSTRFQYLLLWLFALTFSRNYPLKEDITMSNSLFN